MRSIILLSLSLFFGLLYANAQFRVVPKESPMKTQKKIYEDVVYEDVVYEDVVYEVEDMQPDEIRAYNSMLDEGISPDESLLRINAARAQRNLTNAPATIVWCRFNGIDSIGANDIEISLINCRTKLIREITFKFEFEGNSGPVYDIKTGDQFLILKFTNLAGVSDSNNYSDIVEGLSNCSHHLCAKDASYKKPFFNKKAKKATLNSVLITYNDGTISSKVETCSSYRQFYTEGPLSPVAKLKGKQSNAYDNNIGKFGEPNITAKSGTEGLVGYTAEHWGRPHSKWTGTVKLKVVVNTQGCITSATVVDGSGEAYSHQEVRDYCKYETLKSRFSVPKNKTTDGVGYVTWRFL